MLIKGKDLSLLLSNSSDYWWLFMEYFNCELDSVSCFFFREVEEIEDASFKSRDRSLKTILSNGAADESIRIEPIEVRFLSHLVKACILVIQIILLLNFFLS